MGDLIRRFPTRACRRAALVGMLFAALNAASPGAGKNPFRAIPPDAWMVFSIPDLPAAWHGLSQTPLYRAAVAFLDSPIGALIPTYREFLRQRQRMESKLGFPLDGTSLAGIISAVDFISLPPSAGDEPLSVCVFHAADLDRFHQLFEYLTQTMINQVSASATPEASIQREKYKGVEIVSTNAGLGVAMAALDSERFAMADQPEAIRRMIDQAKKNRGIDANPAFHRAMSGLQENEPHGVLYLNSRRVSRVLRRRGLSDLPASALFRVFRNGIVMAADFHIEPDVVRFESFLPFDNPEGGGLPAIYRHAPRARLRSLDYISSAPLLFTARNTIDGLALYKGLRAFILGSVSQKSPPDNNPAQTVEAAEERFSEVMGFSLKDDLAPAIGPEMYISVEDVRLDPLLPLPFLDVVGGIEIFDAERMDRVLNGLGRYFERELRRSGATRTDRSAEGPLRTKSHLGKTIHWFPIPNASPYSFAYVRTGGFVLAGFGVDGVMRAMDRAAGRSKGFRSGYLATRLRPYLHEQANEILVINFQKVLVAAREIARRFLKSDDPLQAQSARLALGLLDRLSVLSALGATTAATAGGLHTRGALVFEPAKIERRPRR